MNESTTMIYKSILAAAFLALLAAPAAAQDFGAAFTGFSTGSNEPIQIESDQLEVRDPDKVAVYTGNVRVRQGGTVLETPELRVHYTGEAQGETPGSAVQRIEAGPGVMVRTQNQSASGDQATLELPRDLVTMSGNVVLTQGDNVVRGDRLVVNLKTKQAQMQGGRVQTLIAPARSAGQ